MRLTLRNLLRFLDQANLRSIERSRLEQLVDESEKADAWIQRIDVLRRDKSTSAPAVESNDPPTNRVAAYLDSTMNEQHTIEFEKSMLGSDQLLAEVASCHEIRESIRNESNPAIPILLRQSIYDIGRGQVNYDQPESTTDEDGDDEAGEIASDQKVAALAAAMQDLPYVDGKPDDPNPIGGFTNEGDEPDDEHVSLDSLSNKAQKRSRMVLVGLLALATGMLGLTYWLGVQAGKRPRTLAGNPSLTNTNMVSDSDPDNPSPDDADKKGSNANDSDGSDNDATGATDSGLANQGGDNKDGDTEEAGTDNVAENDGKNSGEEPKEASSIPGEGGTLIADQPQPAPEKLADNNPDKMPDSELPQRPILGTGIESTVTADAEVDPLAPKEGTVVASVVRQKPTLLRYSDAKESLLRVAANDSLVEGNHLIVLPGTSSEIDFSGNIKLRIEGPASFSMGQRDVASGADVIQPHYGTFVVTSTVADVDLIFQRSGAKSYNLILPVAESRVTAEFTRYQSPGDDSRDTEPATVDFFVANKGRATLQQDDNTWLLAESNGMFCSDSKQPSQVVAPVSGLVDLPNARPRDYSIRLRDTIGKNFWDLSDQLSTETPLLDFLAELKNDIRQERRFAALSWLAFTGNYTYLIDFLSDEKNRNNWRSVIEAVRASVHLNPDFTKTLYECLSLAGNEERDIMFKLLLGYSQTELELGADESLVKLLDHDSLPVRVLAIERIRQITGGLAYGYTPNADRKIRRRIIDKQWKKALKKKEVRYSTPPTLQVPTISLAPEEGIGESAEDASGIE